MHCALLYQADAALLCKFAEWEYLQDFVNNFADDGETAFQQIHVLLQNLACEGGAKTFETNGKVLANASANNAVALQQGGSGW